ncbi:zeta toxin family protein [Rhizobium sp. Root482]|jgi:predicted ABC-type ATPase|uniref:zeta toxin family protein n=1 Tax=Rhizobium sp. Root482 TaxID=1736543 RepID=UPI0012E3B170|nr:zeta toxin family protein [Rhizobium sp. Root482]
MPELSCILLAGPNGSGKSSAFAKLDLEGVWINADEIAKAIPSDHDGRSTDMQAGKAALLKIAEMIEARQSFIFETTLSSMHYGRGQQGAGGTFQSDPSKRFEMQSKACWHKMTAVCSN